MEIVAQVDNLSHIYPGGVEALKDINLILKRGEKVAIVGQNGSGKTTLSKHFNGLLRPTKGSIKINGMDVAKKKVGEMAKYVGYVFQNPNYQLFSSTVREEIKFGLKNLKLSDNEIKVRTKETLEAFNLTGVAKKQPMSLSGGVRKIVALASVYAMQPSILFLDEPTTGQDQPGKTRIGELIQTMAENGHTIVVITHDMNFVVDFVDRVVVMVQGKIIKDGTPGEIFSDEKTMKKAHIQAPQVVAMANRMRDKGVDIDVLTAKQLASTIVERGILK